MSQMSEIGAGKGALGEGMLFRSLSHPLCCGLFSMNRSVSQALCLLCIQSPGDEKHKNIKMIFNFALSLDPCPRQRLTSLKCLCPLLHLGASESSPSSPFHNSSFHFNE